MPTQQPGPPPRSDARTRCCAPKAVEFPVSQPLLVYQGGITLLAGTADALLTEPMVTEMTATGGVILAALAAFAVLFFTLGVWRFRFDS